MYFFVERHASTSPVERSGTGVELQAIVRQISLFIRIYNSY